MLPANELAQLRSDILATLPDTCDILSVTRTSDSNGGWTEAWGTASEAVACRMDHKVGREMLSGGAVQTYQGNMLTLPYDATVSTANRILYGGNYYNVLAVSEGSALAVLRVMVERV